MMRELCKNHGNLRGTGARIIPNTANVGYQLLQTGPAVGTILLQQALTFDGESTARWAVRESDKKSFLWQVPRSTMPLKAKRATRLSACTLSFRSAWLNEPSVCYHRQCFASSSGSEPRLVPRFVRRLRHIWFPMLVMLAMSGCGAARSRRRCGARRGVANGDFIRPRAIAIDAQDRLFIVDYTARIQVYDRDGRYLGPTWTTPDYRNGRPSGLSIARDGNLIVSDSHYNCFRIYSADGRELRKFGGTAGTARGNSVTSAT